MFTIPIVIIIGGFFPGIQLSVPFMDDAFSFQNVEDIVTVVWQGEFVFVTAAASRLTSTETIGLLAFMVMVIVTNSTQHRRSSIVDIPSSNWMHST